MLAVVRTSNSQSPNNDLSDVLSKYGLTNIIEWDQESGPPALSDAKGAHTEVIYINGHQALRKSAIRRLTLSSARLSSAFTVWDSPQQNQLVAARLKLNNFHELALNGQDDFDEAFKKLVENKVLESYDIDQFSDVSAIRIGGSFAGSGIQRFYGKTASGRGAKKLRDEMRMYQSLPEEFQDYYPKLLFAGEDAKGTVSLGTRYENYPNLRDLLLNMEITLPEATSMLEKVLAYEYGQADLQHRQIIPADYMHDLHFHRVWRRIAISADLDPGFMPLVESPWLEVNGERLPNIPAMLLRLEQDQEAVKRLQPDGVSPFIHADLHLENILCDIEGGKFWLVDPRGYPACDIFYDLGKLAHSYHSYYDLLHEGRHVADHSYGDGVSVINYDFIPKHLVSLYADLDAQMEHIVHDMLDAHGEAKDVNLRIRFNEAMHFCSDMPFHISSKAKPCIAQPIYGIGAKLLAEVLRMLNIDLEECVQLQEAGLARLAEMGKKPWRFEG